MELIAGTVLTGTTTSVSFSSIPQNFRDLMLVIQPSTSSTTAGFGGRINGDSGFSYTFVRMQATSSSVTSTLVSPTSFDFGRASGSVNDSVIVHLLDYSQTNKHKPLLTKIDSSAETTTIVQRWANTSAVTSISVQYSSASWTFGVGSTFYLYGIPG